jgi:hypothetical protein
MSGGRWVRYILPAILVLGSIGVVAGPAAAAPCVGFTCVRTYADITVTVTASPWFPIAAGGRHSYTVRVTNTGWRVGGLNAPAPTAGPDSGIVYVVLNTAAGEVPVGLSNDSGEPFVCYNRTPMACEVDSIPTNTTSQFTFTWQAPTAAGTYTCGIHADSYLWNEYDENNNDASVTFIVI